MKCFLFFLNLLLISLSVFSQNSTLNTNEKPNRDVSAAHKVLLIPFEPKLYLSEIDHNINSETKLTAREIKFKFRDGLNEQLYKAFKVNKFNVVDLMDDTTKYKKDLNGIYQYLSYEYLKVPNQQNYKAPKREKEEKKIDKGQLNVETNSDARFMNARVTNPKLVPLLYAKHKTDLFVFINQLDLKASGSKDPMDLTSGSGLRKIIVHYTVYTYDAKEINSGIVEEEFEPELNVPKKIIDKHFSKVASTIVQRVNKALISPSK